MTNRPLSGLPELAENKEKNTMSYIIRKASGPVALDADFDTDPQWANANVITPSIRIYRKYNIFVTLWRKMTGAEEREANDPYAPETSLKLLYDDKYIYGLFQVKDQYVRATAKNFGDMTCVDSCVEFFIRPANNVRYYNFEFNAGGHMLLYNITDLRKKKFSAVPEADCETVQRFHTLPEFIDPEIKDPVTWRLGFAVPVAFFVKFGDNVNASLSGQTWSANVFKCAELTSHPHWFTWQPLPKLDFHRPDCFTDVTFE